MIESWVLRKACVCSRCRSGFRKVGGTSCTVQCTLDCALPRHVCFVHLNWVRPRSATPRSWTLPRTGPVPSRETVLVQYDARSKLYSHCRCQPMLDPFPRSWPRPSSPPVAFDTFICFSSPTPQLPRIPAGRPLPGFGLGPALWTGVDIRIRRSARQNDCVVTLFNFLVLEKQRDVVRYTSKDAPPFHPGPRSSVTVFNIFVASRTGSDLVPSLLSMV